MRFTLVGSTPLKHVNPPAHCCAAMVDRVSENVVLEDGDEGKLKRAQIPPQIVALDNGMDAEGVILNSVALLTLLRTRVFPLNSPAPL